MYELNKNLFKNVDKAFLNERLSKNRLEEYTEERFEDIFARWEENRLKEK